jgi:hypothetical protein
VVGCEVSGGHNVPAAAVLFHLDGEMSGHISICPFFFWKYWLWKIWERMSIVGHHLGRSDNHFIIPTRLKNWPTEKQSGRQSGRQAGS